MVRTMHSISSVNSISGLTFACNIQELKSQFVCGSQGCGLRKITRSPKVPNYEILDAQHLSLL